MNCCKHAERNIECRMSGPDETFFCLYGDDFLTPLVFCPFCGTHLQNPDVCNALKPPHLALQQMKETATAKRICFDMDRVVAKGSFPYSECTPYPGVLPLIKQLKENGFTIIYQTARYMGEYDGNQEKAHDTGYLELRYWLEEHGFPWDEIYMGKAQAHIYVDDRGCRIESEKGFGDWYKNFLPLLAKE